MSRFTLHEWIQQIETEIAASKVHNHLFRKESSSGTVNGIRIEMIEKGIQKLEWLKELQRYKDLEEAGRLIELPCKVGDTVWIVGTKCLSGLHEKKCGNIALCDDCPLDREMIVFDRIFDWHLFCTIQERKCKRDGKLLFVWGETVFANKADAEAKLAELKGGEE